MAFGRIGKYLRLFCAVALLFICAVVAAREHHGTVTFGGVPLPGVTVTASQGDKKFTAVTDDQGQYSFPDLPDGNWRIEIVMQGFSPMTVEVVVGPNAPPAPPWELKMLPLDQMNAVAEAKAEPAQAPSAPAAPAPQAKNNQPNAPVQPGQTKPATQPGQANPAGAKPADAAPTQEETDQRASDGLLINGSMNNGAASPFAQMAAFGNNRNGGRSLYTGSIAAVIGNSIFNANQFPLAGLATPKPQSSQITILGNFGGPIKIPRLWKAPPNFAVNYQWTRNGNDTTLSGLVPTIGERDGNFTGVLNSQGQQVQIFNPMTGLPFAGNTVPISPQALALLNLYPMPNVTGSSRYNYQIPVINNSHIDAMQARLGKTLSRKDQINGTFAFQAIRSSNPNLFGFLDTSTGLGQRLNVNWIHRYSQHWTQTVGYTFSRQATLVTPFFDNRENISGEAGITGNNQNPTNWGPPNLSFSTISGMSDQQASHNRTQTGQATYSMLWNHRNHTVQFGGDYIRREFNYLTQQNPRGAFSFTGAATTGLVGGVPTGGLDFADFLLGIPDSSSIAFGNADKYLRQSVYDLYINDDWKVTPKLTISAGVRWDYGAPITELFGRLVNLDITPTYSAESPVLATNPVGSLTGQAYPTSLVRPDKHGYQPKLGLSWRPISGSSMVVRAGYGVNFDTSVYTNIALQMAQQAPLSTSLNVQNSTACPLTLANGFVPCSTITPDSFAIDPNFRVGYVQTWQLIVQRDLPGSFVVTVTYLGNKGTRGPQEFLPNTYPVGATNPCPSCPAGFAFLTSNGNSTREAGSVQLRRRLHNGLTATATYTFSKSIDDDAGMGGGLSGTLPTAQNWLNLTGERGLSTFDQRHLLNTTLQYTTGMGLGGRTLMTGWKGKLFKEWTFFNQITLGSGLPQSPVYFAVVPGTGIAGTLRPDVVAGQSLYAAPTGLFLNPAAFATPAAGQFGDAGRDSITGPIRFSLNGSMSRTFRINDRFNLDFRLDSTNLLNHVTYTSWNTIVGSPLFGTPANANQMRVVTSRLTLRF
jgi:hypothetical protein